ncbi:MAG: hypothetical protein FWF10_00780 [Clostridiales bacterium]|nr:hypothetical protein [Clostridiales bacterium]
MYIDNFHIDPNWCVVEDAFDIGRVRHIESVMALGTGYMTTRASFDEGFADDAQNAEYDRIPGNVSLEVVPCKKSRWGSYIQLVQGRHPFWRTGIVNLPYYLGLEVWADGERLDMESSQISGYRMWLNLRKATLYRTFVWTTSSGKVLNLLFKRYMDPKLRFVCVQKLCVRALSGDASLLVQSYIDNDVRTNGFDKYSARATGVADGGVICSDITTNLGDRVVTASKLVCDVPAEYSILPLERRIVSGAAFSLAAGNEADIFKVSATTCSLYSEKNPLDEGLKLIRDCMQAGEEELHRRHTEQWAKYWADCDIAVAARDDAGYNSQRAIRQAIYHLLRARSSDPRALNCAKGTTSEMYLGSVCWDMELFFQPFYIYTRPELAKMTHLYRYGMLDGARRSAQSMHYLGARYPWQTDRNGDEVCPMFEYADHEIHITADVVIGLWHYYCNTLDKEYLYNCGLEIIIETARYWTSRVNRIPGRPGYQLLGVMGPDEYKPFSNNNAYTNFVVRENLRLAATVVRMCKADAPELYKQLCKKIAFRESELALFNEIADGMSIPQDSERNIIWQCDDFETAYAEIDIKGLWADRDKLFGFYTTQELRYRSKCLKQSDVIALMGVYTEAFTKEQMAASFDYYNPYTIHDSSNSLCHNAIVAALIGRPETAYANWKKSMDIDFGARPRAAEGIHFANVGGMWQELIMGFAGLVSALNSDTLTFKPCMPEQIASIAFQMIWKGQRVKVTVARHELVLQNLSDSELVFMVYERAVKVIAGSEITAQLGGE